MEVDSLSSFHRVKLHQMVGLFLLWKKLLAGNGQEEVVPGKDSGKDWYDISYGFLARPSSSSFGLFPGPGEIQSSLQFFPSRNHPTKLLTFYLECDNIKAS